MATDDKRIDAFWNAAFTFGELTCDKCKALLSANREDDYSELATQAQGLGWSVTDNDADGFEILCPACSQLGPHRLPQVQVVNVPMDSQPNLGSFDLGRLTLVGVLTSLLAVAGCMALMIAVLFAFFDMFPTVEKKVAAKIAGTVGAVVGFGFFFAAKAILQALGVSVVRPKPESVSVKLLELNRRLSLAKGWRMFFLVSMSVGLVLTLGIAWALADVAGPGGFAHFQVLGVGGLVLPILLAGFLLMHTDVGRHSQALAAARQAGH